VRIFLVSACIAVLALALVSVAGATPAFQQNVSLRFSSSATNASSGINANLQSSDPLAPGGKPKAATRIQLVFPAGTKFNTRVPARCTESNQGIIDGDCPRRSRVTTSGSGSANAFPLLQTPVTLRITGYNIRNGIAFLVDPSVGASFVLRARISANRLTVVVPQLRVGITSIVLTRFTVNIPAKRARVNNRRQNYITTASRCTTVGGQNVFATTFRFTYNDGSAEAIVATSRCRR
jgi:hypothetical protein